MVNELQIRTAVLVAPSQMSIFWLPHQGLVIRGPVHQVRGEQPAEEHDFGQQEHPHAEGGSLPLLLHVGEVMLQRVLSDLDIASGQR